jgi:hypothetical protein
LRLPSVRIEAAAGFPVGRGRFISSGLTVAPSGRDRASRGLLSLPLLSPMERGASTLGALPQIYKKIGFSFLACCIVFSFLPSVDSIKEGGSMLPLLWDFSGIASFIVRI